MDTYALITCFDGELDVTLHSSQQNAYKALLEILLEQYNDLIMSLMRNIAEDQDLDIDDDTVYLSLRDSVFSMSMTPQDLSNWCGEQMIWDTWSIKPLYAQTT